ncbi:MAG: hypothetical protein CL532_01655 [Aestuariivita sp.]|nr:hypothetical protein [Aestuariivita sp.]|tara:strand:- start:8661 stop:9230 length:570 start_codon:yes stop_codon:yes gene_type:complete
MNRVIGLAGPKGCGKSTFASKLCIHYGFTAVSFSYPIKAMLHTMGVDMQLLTDPVRKEEVIEELGCSPRYLMQTLGTEWGRTLVDDQLWLKLAKKRIESDSSRDYVVDDVRFVNECELVHSLGGCIIRFDKDKQTQDSHTSEAGLPNDLVEFDISGFKHQDPDEFVQDFMEIKYNGTFNNTKPQVELSH